MELSEPETVYFDRGFVFAEASDQPFMWSAASAQRVWLSDSRVEEWIGAQGWCSRYFEHYRDGAGKVRGHYTLTPGGKRHTPKRRVP